MKVVNFIHNPKTGGGTIERAFKGRINYMGHSFDHPTAQKTYMVFRNPYDRLRSAFDWVIGGGDGKRADIEEKNLLLTVSRKNLELILWPKNYKKLKHFVPQCRYMTSDCTLIPYSKDIVGQFRKYVGVHPSEDIIEPYNASKSQEGEWYTFDDVRYLVDRVYAEDMRIWLDLCSKEGYES